MVGPSDIVLSGGNRSPCARRLATKTKTKPKIKKEEPKMKKKSKTRQNVEQGSPHVLSSASHYVGICSAGSFFLIIRFLIFLLIVLLGGTARAALMEVVKDHRDAAVALGVRYGIASSVTSFVCVRENESTPVPVFTSQVCMY